MSILEKKLIFIKNIIINIQMNKQKINKDSILEAIEKQADIIVKKHQLYESVKEINEELKKLYESAPPMVGSYGFSMPEDSSKKNSITGFEKNPNISYIAQLEKELGDENKDTSKDNSLNEMENIRIQNEELKRQIEELKNKK